MFFLFCGPQQLNFRSFHFKTAKNLFSVKSEGKPLLFHLFTFYFPQSIPTEQMQKTARENCTVGINAKIFKRIPWELP